MAAGQGWYVPCTMLGRVRAPQEPGRRAEAQPISLQKAGETLTETRPATCGAHTGSQALAEAERHRGSVMAGAARVVGKAVAGTRQRGRCCRQPPQGGAQSWPTPLGPGACGGLTQGTPSRGDAGVCTVECGRLSQPTAAHGWDGGGARRSGCGRLSQASGLAVWGGMGAAPWTVEESHTSRCCRGSCRCCRHCRHRRSSRRRCSRCQAGKPRRGSMGGRALPPAPAPPPERPTTCAQT